MPGATSRWNRGKDLSWEPLRPELVVEVAFDHLQGDRFRHASTFRRWRPDKPVDECTYSQLEETPAFELERIFGVSLSALVRGDVPTGEGALDGRSNPERG